MIHAIPSSGDGVLSSLKQRTRRLKTESYALYLVARHPDMPWHAKLFIAAVAAYAFSPIDLIPDFVPVLGFLDDLVLVPLGIALAIKMVPPPLLMECRARAQEAGADRKLVSQAAAIVIMAIWLTLTALCLSWIYRWIDE
jgi:uncharacterized membrane protein YkvA (DUF1232 family)